MEAIILIMIIFIFTISWMLLDEKQVDYIYEEIDKIEDDERVVVLFKKTKINE
ncbi:hypothetical protein ACNQFZ_02015 [Schinkia sp. CFF1]